MNGEERPELDEEVVEEVAEKSAAILGKKTVKGAAIIAGFAAVGIALAKVLSVDDNIYVIEETGEVVDDPNAAEES